MAPWRWLARGALVAATALLGYLLLTPAPPDAVTGNDKLGHLLAFGGWATLWWWSFGHMRLTLALCCIGAVATEWLQGYIPGRTPELADAVANLTGTGMALAFWGLVQPIRP